MQLRFEGRRKKQRAAKKSEAKRAGRVWRRQLSVPEGLFCQLKRQSEAEEKSSGGLKAGGGRRGGRHGES